MLLVLETKAGGSVPNSQFGLVGYIMFRYGKDSFFGGDLCLYVNEKIL